MTMLFDLKLVCKSEPLVLSFVEAMALENNSLVWKGYKYEIFISLRDTAFKILKLNIVLINTKCWN